MTDDSATPRPTRRWPAVAGGIAAALALGVTELLAGLITMVPSLVVAVGDVVVDWVPTAVRETAIELFGLADKAVLLGGILVVSVAAGAALGVAARRRFWVAAAGFGAFGLLGALAGSRDPLATPAMAWAAAAVATAIGLYALRALLQRVPATREEDPTTPIELGPDRRAFLRAAAAVGVLAVGSGGLGRSLVERARTVVAGRDEVSLPAAATPLPGPPPAASLEVTGLSPVVTPNDEFYRIDTALAVPRVDLSEWQLGVQGLVERPFEISFSELLDLPMVERYVTLACVSNEVGGDLVGNAKWLGTPLAGLLDRAGVRPEAGQIVGRSVDGFTVGFPVSAAYDGREALVAVGMNGEPLPFRHGFPARLVVAGLYGYVSATKWLSEIELTTWEGFNAYWVPRGWAKEAPIKTQSRIDRPRRGAQLDAGPEVIAGVAWAPHRGISKVEVQVDEGPWQQAELAAPLSDDAWLQWRLDWEAEAGIHLIRVRATDRTGETQPADRRPPAPDGATGYHTVRVQVV